MAKKYGQWIVEKSLSEGGQAHTFLVYNEKDESKYFYVLKRFKNTKRLKRYKNEVKAAMALEHPNIIKYVDSDLESDKPYMVMEYCRGGPLSKAGNDNFTTIGRLHLFREICDGVGYAHRKGIIHRDLKPDNIFLREDGRTPVVGDFGICYIDDKGERITLIDEAVGGRRFTAPELEDGRIGKISATADVYSLGKILYWIFMQRVFDREKHRDRNWNITNIERDIPNYRRAELTFINELLDYSINIDPDKRYNDADHFRANIDHTIWRIKRNAHTLDHRDIQLCNFCGIGEYQPIVDPEIIDKHDNNVLPEYFGIRKIAGTEFIIFWCNYCGHVQHFKVDIIRSKGQDPWRRGDIKTK